MVAIIQTLNRFLSAGMKRRIDSCIGDGHCATAEGCVHKRTLCEHERAISPANAEELYDKICAEAFRAGYRAGVAAQRAAEALANADKVPRPLDTQRNPFRSGCGAWRVFEYVKANPGQKPAQIRDALQLTAKTAAMALSRMRRRGYAINRDGWRLR